ncbi:Photoreceptor dehydrogenase [Carabus blaptoides fortunei]
MNIVMSSSSNAKLGEEELNQLRRKYIRSSLCFLKCDVTNFEDMSALFKTATSMFGTIDIVINNAGIFKDSNWSKMIDINLKGVIYGTKLGMNCMSKDAGGKGGAIVNVASVLGLAPLGGAPAYTATKHGVIGYTRAMAMPYHYNKSGVRVMAMCPGVTDTHLIKKANTDTNTPLDKEASRELTVLPKQHVCYCGQCLMEMLKEGDTGSIWVVEDKEIYEVEIPERNALKKIM